MKQDGTSLANIIELLQEAERLYPDYVNLDRVQDKITAALEMEESNKLIVAEQSGKIISLNRYRKISEQAS